jgi:hypothetical protein
MSFPTNIDTFTTIVDNVDTVVAAHPNDRAAAIVALETKLGANSSVVNTTIDYFLKNASGAYRNHTHSGASNDGAHLPIASISTGTPDGTKYVSDDGSLKTPSLIASGMTLQVVQASNSAYDYTTNVIPWDSSAPQDSEGKEAISKAITPTSAANLLLVRAEVWLASGSGSPICIATLFSDKDGTADALDAGVVGSGVCGKVTLERLITAGTTDLTTFKVMFGSQNGNQCELNGNQGGVGVFGSTPKTSLTIIEFKG